METRKKGYHPKRKNTMGDIAKIQKKAMEMNMTYGEYVARMGVYE